MPIARRTLLLGGIAILPAATVSLSSALAAESLPDARFVGYAQQINDFEIASGKMALAKSMNENVRGFANHMIVDHSDAAEVLRKNRSEAGVSYAPDPAERPHTVVILRRLGTLEGNEFDTAYANAQLAVLTEAERQYAANSESSGGGPVMRYAQHELPRMQKHLEYARGLAGGR